MLYRDLSVNTDAALQEVALEIQNVKALLKWRMAARPLRAT
jgi:hypothetical protein